MVLCSSLMALAIFIGLKSSFMVIAVLLQGVSSSTKAFSGSSFLCCALVCCSSRSFAVTRFWCSPGSSECLYCSGVAWLCYSWLEDVESCFDCEMTVKSVNMPVINNLFVCVYVYAFRVRSAQIHFSLYDFVFFVVVWSTYFIFSAIVRCTKIICKVW